MNKRRFQRAVLLTGFIGLLLLGGYSVWLFQVQRNQYALNRQLIAALTKQDTSQALLLVNKGADPNTPHDPPPTPSLKHFLDHLLPRSALPETENNSPTAFLIACGWTDVWSPSAPKCPESPQLVQAMLVHHANINTTNDDRRTALHWAVWSDYRQTASVLLEHGASVNAVDVGRWTPLMAACTTESPEMVRLLLDHKAVVNLQDEIGQTGLYMAVFHLLTYHPGSDDRATTDTIRQLIAHKADTDLPDQYGNTPLHRARQWHRSGLIALLQKAGAKK